MATSRRYQGVHPPDCPCIYCIADRAAAGQGGTSRIGRGAQDRSRRVPGRLLGRVRRILTGEELQERVQRARQARLTRKRQLYIPKAVVVIVDNLVFLLAITLFIFMALPSEQRDVLIGLLE